jgi:rubrerythrin
MEDGTMKTTTTDALELLREHERALGRLYRIYAECFAAQSELWLRLAAEEDQHAQWLGALSRQSDDSEAGPLVNRFPVGAIEHSLIYINKLIDSARDSGVTLLRALSVAVDLEEALLENRYFEVCEGDGPELKRTFESLAEGTHAHLAAVKQAWQAAREASNN